MSYLESQELDTLEIRRRAEEAVRKDSTVALFESLPLQETHQLMHELRVHQVELEMQNEELRCAQEALEESRLRYYDLYDFAPVGYLTVSEKGLILEANLTAATLLALPRSELVTRPFSHFILPEEQDIYYMHRKKLFDSGDQQTCELQMRKEDGTTFWGEIVATLDENAEGVKKSRILVSDISTRKHYEDERDLTAHLVLLLNTPGELRERISAITASLQRWSGCEAVGLRLCEGDDYPYYETRGFPPEFIEAERYLCTKDSCGKVIKNSSGLPLLECMCGNVLQGRFDPTLPFFTTNGSFWCNGTSTLLASTTDAERQSNTRNRCNKEGYESVALVPLHIGDSVLGLLQFNDHEPNKFTAEKISHFERLAGNLAIALAARQADDSLKEREHDLKEAQKIAKLGSWTYNPQTELPAWSEGMFLIWGLDPEEGTPTLDEHRKLIHPDDWPAFQDAVQAAVEKGIPYELELRVCRPDGEERVIITICTPHVDGEGKVYKLTGTSQDITARRNVEERLRQSEKMTAIGQLAGGIAHDFNNQLSPVIGYADMLLKRLDDPTLRRFTENICTASRRAADLTDQLLAFSHKGKYLTIPVDIHKAIAEVISILEHSIDKRISIKQVLDANPHKVLGDPTQLQNALLNLAVNARDAMPDGGKLTFATSIVHLQADQIAPEMPSGQYLQLSVADTGCGMAEETQKHIFEPFFTTKKVGKGTGLGLASVHGAIHNHHGSVSVKSREDEGTTITLHFPLLECPDSPKNEDTSETQANSNEHILIVDDEPGYVQLLLTCLAKWAIRYQVVVMAKMLLPSTKNHGSLLILSFSIWSCR